MPFSLRTHEYKRNDATPFAKLKKTNFYLRFSADGKALYLQGGSCWSEGGDHIDPIPQWVIEEAKKALPQALQIVGFKLENGRLVGDSEPVKKPKEKTVKVASHVQDLDDGPLERDTDEVLDISAEVARQSK